MSLEATAAAEEQVDVVRGAVEFDVELLKTGAQVSGKRYCICSSMGPKRGDKWLGYNVDGQPRHKYSTNCFLATNK